MLWKNESENYNFLCRDCHRQKTQDDHQRMHIADHNCWISRFNKETWAGFVESRRPAQVVYDLHDADPKLECLELDIRSCRLITILEANQEDVPIYSPLDEFEDPIEGELYDWM